MHLSQYLQSSLAGWISGSPFAAVPSGLFLSVSTADPSADGSTAAFAGARQPFTLGTVQTTEIDGSFALNVAPIILNSLPAGSYTHVAVFDAVTGGNMLMYGPIAVTQAVVGGGSVSFAANALALGMAGSFSKYLGELIINWLKLNAFPTAPSGLFAGLSTAPILRTGLGLAEPVPGYARQVFTANAPSFTLGTGTKIDANEALLFGPSTAPWGLVTHVGIFTNAGNLLFHKQLPMPIGVNSGAGLSWAEGGLILELN